MPTLYLAHQGAKLRLRQGKLILQSPEDKILLQAPARKIRRVLIFGNVHLTTPALVFLLRHEAKVFFYSLTGTLYGYAGNESPPSPDRIRKQLQAATGPQALEIAKKIIYAKIRSQREALRRYGFKVTELEPLDRALIILRKADNIAYLHGLEGMASKLYFTLVSKTLKRIPFEHRRKRPPKDPVNAALSYAYAVLYSITLQAVQGAELHPEIGILHMTGRRRASLALDLMEEFRVPIVDIPIFEAFRRGVLKSSHGMITDQAVLLNDEGRKIVIQLMEERLKEMPMPGKSYLMLIFQQAERLASAIVHGKAYEGFSLRR